MKTGYSERKTPSFSQILQLAIGVIVTRNYFRGVSEACFKNSANSECLSVRFVQYPSREKSYYVHYENRDRLLSRTAFEQRVRQKYGRPNPKRGMLIATADLIYGKRHNEELVVWLGRKTMMLKNGWISRQADKQIREAKKKSQSEIDANGTATSSF